MYATQSYCELMNIFWSLETLASNTDRYGIQASAETVHFSDIFTTLNGVWAASHNVSLFFFTYLKSLTATLML